MIPPGKTHSVRKDRKDKASIVMVAGVSVRSLSGSTSARECRRIARIAVEVTRFRAGRQEGMSGRRWRAQGTLELLYGIAGAFENQYCAQIRRYYDDQRMNEGPCRHRQLDLFDGHHDDVEF